MAMAALEPWYVRGSYLEACNCDAICPCRRINGVPGGRSTYGICEGVLFWRIEDGRAAGVDLSDLSVVLATRYSDDEPGSPHDFVVFVDDRGDESQRHALGEIFSGHLGGSVLDHFPWAWKASHLLGIRSARIEHDTTRERRWFRVRDLVSVRVSHPVADPATVTCVIPGHHQPGQEYVAESLWVGDEELSFEAAGKCAFRSVFEYESRDSQEERA